ncbi:MAG: hypothetical protein WA982_11865 [Rubrobacteraceae bacterium]
MALPSLACTQRHSTLLVVIIEPVGRTTLTGFGIARDKYHLGTCYGQGTSGLGADY